MDTTARLSRRRSCIRCQFPIPFIHARKLLEPYELQLDFISCEGASMKRVVLLILLLLPLGAMSAQTANQQTGVLNATQMQSLFPA